MSNILRRAILFSFIALLSIQMGSCDAETAMFGMTVAEFRMRIASGDAEFLESLPTDEGLIRSAERAYPGASFFLAEASLSAGLDRRAETWYGYALARQKDPWYVPALRQLRRLYLEQERYEDVLQGEYRPDPRRADWYYAQRFEALLRTGRARKAYDELEELRARYPDAFSPMGLSHSLLYYQAVLAARFPDAPGSIGMIEPYVFISDARGGHGELAVLLEGAGAAEELLPWIRAKSEAVSGDYAAALDILTTLIDGGASARYAEAALRFLPVRLDEGLPRDLYVAALQTRRYDLGIALFADLSRILESVDDNAFAGSDGREPEASRALALRTKVRLDEYRGRLLLAAGDAAAAAPVFEEAMADLESLRLEIAPGIPSEGDAYRAARDLSVSRERLLWLWISALMEDDAPSAGAELIRAFGYVRNPGYFRDVTREYLADLVARRRWGEILTLAGGAGTRMPSLWRGFSIDLLDGLEAQGEFRVSRDELDRLKREMFAGLPLWNLGFLSDGGGAAGTLFPGSADAADVDYLLPVTRSLSAATLGLRPPVPDDSDAAGKLLDGYADFGMYTAAADHLIDSDPGFRPDPGTILTHVAHAYKSGQWYAGLRLLESALYREILYGGGVGPYISAAGSADDLLYVMYPRAFADIVEGTARERDIPPGLFYALMREESRFDPVAGSHAGARGLGQIIPSTGEDIAWRMGLDGYNLEDPRDNIEMSMFYLSYLRGRFSGFPEALAAYNAGQGRVDRWVRDIARVADRVPASVLLLYLPIEETRDYVPRVLESWQVYEYLYGGGRGPFDELRRPLEPQTRD
jgi:soluble lytic murein transglycosylase